MPELPEIEGYRVLAEQALDRPIAIVAAEDAWFLKRGLTAGAVQAALVGRRFCAARRRGKLLMLDTDRDGPVLGLRFGMTGRLLVDGNASVERLLYASPLEAIRFDRFSVFFSDGGRLVVSDPRRLGGVELDPEEARLGPDASTVTLGQLRAALAGGRVALKARLMDQSHLAGIGNLLADELLWRAGLSPLRPAGSLTPAELRRLQRHMVTGLAVLATRGGSHTGDLMPHRMPGGRCPRDG
ncbi:MAG: hypothetical protein J2P57_20775, partial [Acidimicrobiaceae bacterium]|nr:hypothetical protein [Acidimicrobiaceae bacterium]